MKQIRIPLLLMPIERLINRSKKMRGLAEPLVTPSLARAIHESRMKIKPYQFMTAIMLNALLYVLLFGALMTTLYFSQSKVMGLKEIMQGLSVGFLFGVMIFALSYFYPHIIAGKVAENIDKELLFALQDMSIQTHAGVILFDAMVNVVKSDYGYVSDEFNETVNEIEAGMPMTEALTNLAIRTRSQFMKRLSWQLINSIKAGTDITSALESIHTEMNNHEMTLIQNYTKDLNVLSLIYMTLAVVAPSIGMTMLIILSSFGGLSVTPNTIIMLVGFVLIIQPIFIGFIKSRRPMIRI